MMQVMRGHSPVTRLLALAAAYVVALQLVLLPLSVASADPRSAPLCSELAAGQSGPETNPAAGMDGCGCASGCGMPCCASSLGGSPPAITATDRTSFNVVMPKTNGAQPGLAAWRSPQNPRAPPQQAV